MKQPIQSTLNDQENTVWYTRAMEHLVDIAQELSHAHDLNTVIEIARDAARTLTGADGSTFILRDGDKCHYIEENAISPLWKGQRFPMEACISGWVMNNAEPVSIDDIYKDERIPKNIYEPTFVRSLAMVPIRTTKPIGAIGNYWATYRHTSKDELEILQALANITSIAIANVDLYGQLQDKITSLERSNYELSRFAWAASHDLKSPLRAINNLSQWIEEDIGDQLTPVSQEHLTTMRSRIKRMEKLLEDILEYSFVEKSADSNNEYTQGEVMLNNIISLLDPPKEFTITATDQFKALSAKRMPLQQVLYNLIGNAIKHHDKPKGNIMISVQEKEENYIFSVKDDGPGIPAEFHNRIFEMFQTLKPRDVKEGSGMGLALVKKILNVYNSSISIECENSGGCDFRFTLPKSVVRNV